MIELRFRPDKEATNAPELTALVYQTSRPAQGCTFVLAHGAGAGQRSMFIVEFARALSALGIEVVTFDFPYIAAHRRIPDRGPVLEASYRSLIELVRAQVSGTRPLFIGGKSMGGRIATQVAAADPELPVKGLVLLGYPLHPPGRFDQLRDAHLPSIHRPTLFVQGSRDSFGTPPELEPVLARMSPTPRLHVVPDGDHSFKLARRNPAAQASAYADIQQTIVNWIQGIARRDRDSGLGIRD